MQKNITRIILISGFAFFASSMSMLLAKEAYQPIDPKRKAWHDRRLKEQAAKPNVSAPSAPVVEPVTKPAHTKAVATGLASSLLSTLAAAKTAKPKEEGNKRSEAWKRKPGESVF